LAKSWVWFALLYLPTFTTHQYYGTIKKMCFVFVKANLNRWEILKSAYGQCDSGPRTSLPALSRCFAFLLGNALDSLLMQLWGFLSRGYWTIWLVVHLCTPCYYGNYVHTMSQKQALQTQKLETIFDLLLNWRKGSPQETRPECENSSLGFIEAVHQW